MITGGFGMTMDLERGTMRQWVIGRDGVKRWVDNGAACDGCPRCGGEMIASKALEDVLTGIPDFIGGDVCTVSPSGLARLIDCQKCSKCGHSMTPNGGAHRQHE